MLSTRLSCSTTSTWRERGSSSQSHIRLARAARLPRRICVAAIASRAGCHGPPRVRYGQEHDRRPPPPPPPKKTCQLCKVQKDRYSSMFMISNVGPAYNTGTRSCGCWLPTSSSSQSAPPPASGRSRLPLRHDSEPAAGRSPSRSAASRRRLLARDALAGGQRWHYTLAQSHLCRAT